MRIRLQLTLVFIVLMVLAIMVTISFSILQIRNHLYTAEQEKLTLAAQRTLSMLGQDSTQARMLLSATVNAPWHFVYARGADACADAATNTQLQQALLYGKTAVLDSLIAARVVQGKSTLVLYTSKQTVMDELMPIRWIIYNGMFIATALVAVIAMVFAHRLTRPVLRLRQTAQSIAAGRLENLAAESTRKDELGELALAINQMAGTLKKDNEQLKASSQRQRQFYADITHELKNPLHTLLASLEMLQLPQATPAQRVQYAQVAQASGQRLSRLFNDLMTLQRADADPAFVHKRAVPAAVVLNRIGAIYAPQCAAQNVSFSITAADRTILADPDKLEQVLDNLLSNALKATANGGAIALKGEQRANAYEISVSDTGVGIAPQHLARLTDRFFRTDEARSRDKGGTGLGLAVVKSILDGHGTTLNITSEVGKGARFAFTLPLA
jgi:signal transduction histidine kinase